MNHTSWREWVQLGFRPKTWVAILVPVGVAGLWTYLVSQQTGQYWNDITFILILVTGLLLQIATNLFNDWWDGIHGLDGEDRLGPLRLVGSGKAKSGMVLRVALVILGMAFLGGLVLAYEGGWPVILVGVMSLFLAYGYSAGPVAIKSVGLGEVFVVLFFGVIPSVMTGYLLLKIWSMELVGLGLFAGLLGAGLILANNLRDHEIDGKKGRQTLVVRLGYTRSVTIFRFLLLGAPLMTSWFFLQLQANFIALLPFLTLWRSWEIIQKTPPNELRGWNQILSKVALLEAHWAFMTILGLLLCWKFDIPLTKS